MSFLGYTVLPFNNIFRKSSFLLIILFSIHFSLAAQPASEYHVKAVFIYNFSRFVEWPTQAFTDASSPITIGILGKNVFGSSLKETIQGETVNGHSLEIKYFNSPYEISNCHILYIDKSFNGSLKEIMSTIKTNYTLTVSDAENFTAHAGMIRFYNDGNKIKLEINADAVNSSTLKVSSKLMSVARIYKK